MRDFFILFMVTCYSQLQMGFQQNNNKLVTKMTKHTKLVSDHLHCSKFLKTRVLPMWSLHTLHLIITQISTYTS